MARFAAPGMRPADFSWQKNYSPLTKYSWKKMVQALDDMKGADASPYDDLRLEYFNPHTGGPVMPTIGCYAQKLRASVAHRNIAIAMRPSITSFGVAGRPSSRANDLNGQNAMCSSFPAGIGISI